MKAVVAVALALLVLLQYTLWFGQSGYFAQARLTGQLSEQQERLTLLRERNEVLTAEVLALKADDSAVEARARRDLGMIRDGEIFYLVPSER